MKINQLFMAIVAIPVLFACNNDVNTAEEEIAVDKNDSIVLNMKFMKISQLLGNAETRANIVESDDVDEVKEDSFIVATIAWGKRSFDYSSYNRRCYNRKAHVCYTRWFAREQKHINDHLFELEDDNDGESTTTLLKKDDVGQYYVEILLGEDPQLSDNDKPYITVDEDETCYGTEKLSSVEFTTVQGRYYYDRTLGLYGGFKINIEVNE